MKPSDISCSSTKSLLFAKSIEYSKKKIKNYRIALEEDVIVLRDNAGDLGLDEAGKYGSGNHTLLISG
jgi:hypothetical protein